MNGLNIKPSEFERLPIRQQNRVLYENTEQLKDMIGKYKFHQKIQYSLITVSLAGLGILFKIQLGI